MAVVIVSGRLSASNALYAQVAQVPQAASRLRIDALHETLAQHRDPIPAGVGFASGALAVLPPILIAFVLQRYLVQGLLSGSAKG